jgi:hypothetical protein
MRMLIVALALLLAGWTDNSPQPHPPFYPTGPTIIFTDASNVREVSFDKPCGMVMIKNTGRSELPMIVDGNSFNMPPGGFKYVMCRENASRVAIGVNGTFSATFTPGVDR